MPRRRLRLAPIPPSAAPAAAASDPSRRGFLKFLGCTAIGGTAAASPLARAAMRPLRIARSAGRLAFGLGAEPLWVVDVRRFAGSPRLDVNEDRERLDFRLRGARLPGTGLPADLDCRLSRSLLGWHMHLTVEAFGAHFDVPFEPWLDGQTAARGECAAGDVVSAIGDCARLRVAGGCRVSFLPDWTVRLDGSDALAIDARGLAATADVALVGLLDAGQASLFADSPPARRTGIRIRRQTHRWGSAAWLPEPAPYRIHGEGEVFDELEIESGESRRGNVRVALQAAALSDRPVLEVLPAEHLRGIDGRPVRLGLRRAVLTRTLDSGPEETVLGARFDRRPAWLCEAGCALEMVDPPDVEPPFRMVLVDGRAQSACCEPMLRSVAAAMPDALAAPMRPLARTRVSFGDDRASLITVAQQGTIQVLPQRRLRNLPLPADENAESGQDAAAQSTVPTLRQQRTTPSAPAPAAIPRLQLPRTAPQGQAESGTGAAPAGRTLQPLPALRSPPGDDESAAPAPLPDATVRPLRRLPPPVAADLAVVRPGALPLPDLEFPVIRPEDFLHVIFQLRNLKLEPDPEPRLVRRDRGVSAYVIAILPPQNIHEEALFEDESGGDPVRTPPVRSRLAGDSRLVFRMPDDVEAIPFRLEALLDACGRFPLSVHRNALPPPAPPAGARLQGLPGGADRLASQPGLQPAPGGAVTSPSLPTLTAPGTGSATGTLRALPAPSAPSPAATGMRELAVIPSALRLAPGGPERDQPPGDLETALELPYRLFLSPHANAAWAHARTPVAGPGGRIELWHTRLGVRRRDGGVDEHNDWYRTVRAIWSPDYDPQNMPAAGSGPFRASLDARDRHEIVVLSSDFRIPGYTPLPVRANRLMLTALGAWLDSRGAWEPPCDPNARDTSAPASRSAVNLSRLVLLPGVRADDPCPPGTTPQCPGAWLSVEEWRHRATMGRDHYVRVVYKGYLFPFGHRASLVKVTERRFHEVEEGALHGKVAAYLFQRMFIVVREPLLAYPVNEPEDRRNPFRSVRITTLVTPSLDKPENSDIAGANRRAFWPQVGGDPFLFHLVGEDWRGETSDFTAPLIFLDQGFAKDQGKVEQVIAAYRDAPGERRRRDFGGQGVAYAEITAANRGATTLDTDALTFGARSLMCLSGDRPAFLPHVDQARVRIPAVEALTGGQPSDIRIAATYVANAFGGGNAAGQLFAEVIGANPLSFGADQAGGIATPNINIAGLSRLAGPVGGAAREGGDLADGLEDFAGGEFDPEKYFAGAATEAMILGGLQLFKLFAPKMSSDHAPKLVNTPIYEDDELVAVETRLTWEPPVDPRVPVFRRDVGGKTVFRLEALIVTRLGGGEPETSITGTLTNFSIDLLAEIESFIEIEFESFAFASVSGSKTDVEPKIRDVRFKGALSYVNELSRYLSSAGGGDGASAGLAIDVGPAGVTAGLGISIPTITTGVLTLQNIAFSAGITVPFSGDPMRARFAFCEKDNPFLLTVYCFGGGGYVSLAVGLDGVEQLELAFEFGASVALDIGVASGGVEVMAGIYINIQNDRTLLSGYLRMAGCLQVLGIIRVSLEFNMSLTYDSGSDKTWGECTLTVEIEILFFSASVSMHVRREFSEPTYLPFRDMMTNDDWARYCEAFA